jgi:hypothetical protein
MKVRYKFQKDDKHEVIKGKADRWFTITMPNKDAAEQKVAMLKAKGWEAELVE